MIRHVKPCKHLHITLYFNPNHTGTYCLSRNKPNQHSIGSITGLQQKVDIHISEDEPIKNVDTWFDINAIDDEVTESTRWDKICSTPIIFENQLVNCNAFAVNEPLKMVVIGNVNDSIYRQETQRRMGFN